ncbi:MAG: hypothetical protein IPJ08_14680 [Burkholderiales bacterium]|nr:hypothetical protein [Burkholderiales bacterium]
MEWEFTTEDVVKGHADYTLQDFRMGLLRELKANLGPMDEAQLTRSFNLVYDLCYALATDKNVEEFISSFAYDPPTCQFLAEVQPHMSENAAMLGAILQRQIVERVEANMPLEMAVQDAAKWHTKLVDGQLPELEH